MEEKRRFKRSLCSDLVKLEWKDQRGSIQETSAVLEDISQQGACLQVERPICAGLEAQVSHGDEWGMPCRTVYCVFREIGYFVGVVFDAGKRWSPDEYEPGHLLDLAELALKDCANP